MKSNILILGAMLFILCQNIEALRLSRVKRVSDQRLAELETLIALSKMSGKVVTMPLNLSKVDPKYLGRKRRSQPSLLNILFNHSSKEDAEALVKLDVHSLYKYTHR